MPSTQCKICEGPMPPPTGKRGRPPVYCSDECREHAYVHRGRTAECAGGCGKQIALGGRSRPDGAAMCRECRHRTVVEKNTIPCEECGRTFVRRSATQRFCGYACAYANARVDPADRAPQVRGNTTERGYGAKHQRLRAWWAPRVRRGGVDCARCGFLIEPGEPWDLGHDDHDRTVYTGPEHRDCNRAAGARAATAARVANRTDTPTTSRDW